MRTYKIHLKILFSIFILVSAIYAQSEFSFENISVKDGLSESTVKVMLEDHNGFMYFGTENGLDIYNGYEFKNYHMNSFNDSSMLGNKVSYLFEDSKNFIWIGTDLGISKFDPITKEFSRPISIDPNWNISSFEINEIVEGNQDDIWINLYEYGLLLLHNSLSGVTTCFNCDPNDSFYRKQIHKLFKGQDNAIWLGIDNGLYYKDKKDGEIRILQYDGKPFDKTVTDIEQGDKAILWIGTKDGLYELANGSAGKIKSYKKKVDNNSIVSNRIKDLSWDSINKKLWIGTEDGLSCFIPAENRFYNMQQGPYANSIIENDIKRILVAQKSGRLWYTTENELGINCLSVHLDTSSGVQDTSVMHFEYEATDPNSIADNFINSFIEDKSGHVWIGTGQNGISFHSFYEPKFISKKVDQDNPWGLKNNKIYSIAPGPYGYIWIVSGLGVEYYDSDIVREFDYDKSMIGANAIMDIEFTNNNRLWVASDRGVTAINTDTDEILQIYDREFSYDIMTYEGTKIIVSTETGLVVIDTLKIGKNGENPWTEIGPISGAPFRVINKDIDNNIWLGSDKNGLIKIKSDNIDDYNSIDNYDSNYLDIKHYIYNPKKFNSLSSSTITCIIEDDNKQIWIGTNNGLNRYRKATDDFMHYYVSDGLPSNYITGIVSDHNNNLWISSKKGISFFEQKSESFTNYSGIDGTGNIDFHRKSYAKGSYGNIYFGGPNGITYLNPSEIQYNDYQPPCVITTLQETSYEDEITEAYFSNDLFEGNRIEINHQVKSFRINFVALNFNKTIKNNYRYKLVPFDRDWIESKESRYATYNNLSRGTYTFIVQGSNDDGLWSKPSELTIKFIPHPLLSYWAIGVYAILTAFGIYLLMRHRMYKQKHQLEEERRIKEMDQARDFQMSLIPQNPPEHPDYDIALHMKTSTEVGGDYYDFFPQKDGSMYVVCGDATGHGLNAGMMVSITKAGLYGSDFDTPASTTTRLNKTIKAIDLGTTRMSLNMAKFHNGSFDFTSAGMPPAYLYKGSDGTVEEILVPGLPLGSMKKADFDLHSFDLSSKDALVLISDGLPECVNHDGEMLDYEPVKDCIMNNGNKSAQGIIDSLIKLGDDWMSGLMNDDDITLVVIKKK